VSKFATFETAGQNQTRNRELTSGKGATMNRPLRSLLVEETDPGTLAEGIAAAVLAALRPVLAESSPPLLVDGDEMARLAGVSRATIDRAVRDGIIPSVLVGRARRFRPDAVIDALTVAGADSRGAADHA
jgi:excisionase family DNA binding protein